MPEVGRFASPDTLVPDPGNPQSFNRYSYVLNSPVNYTDPSGHCINNYEAGSADLTTCLAGWNAVGNYLAAATYNAGGAFPNALYNDWLMNADIGMLENLMSVYGIDYGYTFAPPAPAAPAGPPGNSIATNTCNYWQSCYEPVITSEEMQPDAYGGGISGSAAGGYYVVVGGELVWNPGTQELSGFSYHGQGSGFPIEADVAWYGAAIWNLDQNQNYTGISPAITVDLSALVGVQLSLFWEEGTTPFTGDTWGVSVGPSAGGGFAVTGSFSDYTCRFGCR